MFAFTRSGYDGVGVREIAHSVEGPVFVETVSQGWEEIVEEGEAVVVFSQYATFLRRVAEHLRTELGIGVENLDGKMSRTARDNAVTRFGITSAQGGRTTWIDLDTDKWEYVARVEWPPGAPLTLELLSRDQKDLALVSVEF